MKISIVKRDDNFRLTGPNSPQWLLDYIEALRLKAASFPCRHGIKTVKSLTIHISQQRLNFEMAGWSGRKGRDSDYYTSGSSYFPNEHYRYFGLPDHADYVFRIGGSSELFPTLAISERFVPGEHAHYSMKEGNGTTLHIPEETGILSVTLQPEHVIQSISGERRTLGKLTFEGEVKITPENDNQMPSFEDITFETHYYD